MVHQLALLLALVVAYPGANVASATGPPRSCVAPHNTEPWCDASLRAAERAAALVKKLTLPELVAMMDSDRTLRGTARSTLITYCTLPYHDTQPHYVHRAMHTSTSFCLLAHYDAPLLSRIPPPRW